MSAGMVPSNVFWCLPGGIRRNSSSSLAVLNWLYMEGPDSESVCAAGSMPFLILSCPPSFPSSGFMCTNRRVTFVCLVVRELWRRGEKKKEYCLLLLSALLFHVAEVWGHLHGYWSFEGWVRMRENAVTAKVWMGAGEQQVHRCPLAPLCFQSLGCTPSGMGTQAGWRKEWTLQRLRRSAQDLPTTLKNL